MFKGGGALSLWLLDQQHKDKIQIYGLTSEGLPTFPGGRPELSGQ